MPFDYERLRRITLQLRREGKYQAAEGEAALPDNVRSGTMNLTIGQEMEVLPQIYRPRGRGPYILNASRVKKDPDEWMYSFHNEAARSATRTYSPEGETWGNAEDALMAGRKHIDQVEADAESDV